MRKIRAAVLAGVAAGAPHGPPRAGGPHTEGVVVGPAGGPGGRRGI